MQKFKRQNRPLALFVLFTWAMVFQGPFHSHDQQLPSFPHDGHAFCLDSTTGFSGRVPLCPLCLQGREFNAPPLQRLVHFALTPVVLLFFENVSLSPAYLYAIPDHRAPPV